MVDDVINTKVRGFIRGARQVGQPKYLSDTSVEMEFSVPMSGISDIMLPPVTAAQQAVQNDQQQVSQPTATGGITGVIIDARANERFNGLVDEPRPGLKKGRIPNSKNLPINSILNPETNCLKSDQEIKTLFKNIQLFLFLKHKD